MVVRFLLVDFVKLTRLDSFPTTSLPLLAGALVSHPMPDADSLGKLAIIGLLMHVYGNVSNDLIDLDSDSINPRRRSSPLVGKRIMPEVAWFIALTTLPLSYVVLETISGVSLTDYVLLGICIILATLYNTHGKRRFLPPMLPHICFALAIGLLVPLGSHVVTDLIPNAVIFLSLFFFSQAMLANSIHGGLKDLESDLQSDSASVPSWWGVRLTSTGALTCPTTFRIFGMALQIFSMVAILMILMICDDQRYSVLYFGFAGFVALLAALILVDTARVMRYNDLNSFRSPYHPHTVLSAVLIGFVLVYCAMNIVTFAVIITAFAWQVILRGWTKHQLARNQGYFNLPR